MNIIVESIKKGIDPSTAVMTWYLQNNPKLSKPCATEKCNLRQAKEFYDLIDTVKDILVKAGGDEGYTYWKMWLSANLADDAEINKILEGLDEDRS